MSMTTTNMNGFGGFRRMKIKDEFTCFCRFIIILIRMIHILDYDSGLGVGHRTLSHISLILLTLGLLVDHRTHNDNQQYDSSFVEKRSRSRPSCSKEYSMGFHSLGVGYRTPISM